MMIARVFHGIAAHFVVRMYEWLFSIGYILTGFRSLQVQGANQMMTDAYSKLFIPEWLWPHIFIIVGMVRLIALVMNGTFGWFAKYSPTIRSIAAFVSGISWICLSSTILTLVPSGLAPVPIGLLALCELATCMVVAREAGSAYKHT